MVATSTSVERGDLDLPVPPQKIQIRMCDFIDHEDDRVALVSSSSRQYLLKELAGNPEAFLTQRVRVLGVLESFDVPNQVGILRHGDAKILIR